MLTNRSFFSRRKADSFKAPRASCRFNIFASPELVPEPGNFGGDRLQVRSAEIDDDDDEQRLNSVPDILSILSFHFGSRGCHCRDSSTIVQMCDFTQMPVEKGTPV